jgi:hypothetical protein
MESSFHILTMGWDLEVIRRLANPLEVATGFTFSHVLDPSHDRRTLDQYPGARFFVFRDDLSMRVPPADREMLAALEGPGVRTIHNMILGDARAKTLKYEDALDYACFLAKRSEQLYREIQPSVVIGGFDGLHSGIAMAVARRLGIPWFALQFPAIPAGIAGFCTTMSPESGFSCRPASPEVLRSLAEKTLHEFEAKRLAIPAYISANSAAMIIRRLPRHARMFYAGVRRVFTRRADRFTQFSPLFLASEYVRKRINLLFLPRRSFLEAPPKTPYFFFGLHMQPEMSIDVWAPFFANQFAVIEHMARATPPTHEVLVKIHKSDADNYSRSQLRRLQQLPGVRIVSPYVESREFIENASLVFAIQGTMAIEAAMLGRPVLFFGDARFVEMPSVTKVKRVTDLPDQIRAKLSEQPPTREEIIRGLMSFLSFYAPSCYNDWEATPTTAEIEGLADHFRGLRDFLTLQENKTPSQRRAV